MKSSLFLVATSALLASAGPLRKRVIQTDWVYDIVTVTVTAGQQAAAIPTAVFIENKPAPTPEYTPPPPPPPPPPSAPAAPTTEAPPPPPPAPTTTTTPVVYSTPAPSPQPAPTTQPAPAANLGTYEQTILDQHNIHRANHSAPALTWDTTLAGYAANTGKTCVFAHDMSQGGGGYGQNLAVWGGTGNIDDLQVKSAASGVTEQWYNGEMTSWQYYGMSDPPQGAELHDWGHFTQVVWKSSTKVGCATIKCAAGTALSYPSWYTVCNYNPPGNFGGEYGDNVLKPRGDATVTV